MSVNRVRDKKAGHKASRFEAFLVLDGERKYQDGLNGRELTVGEEILLLQEYATRAREEWTTDFDTNPEVEALNMIRKIGAIALRCMEHHGAIPREE